MKEYKLHSTDGKTWFHFRSDPNSRCEAFTVNYLEDGTVVMSGDYGVLSWKRYGSNYGFPNKETGISYFEEKVCQFGITQKIRTFNKDYFIENIKRYYGSQVEDIKKFEEEIELLEDYDEVTIRRCASDYFQDVWETESDKYTDHFLFMFEILKSVSDQIWEAVVKAREGVTK